MEDPLPPTLGYLQRDVAGVFCWCNRCSHNAIVPIGVLIARLGPMLPFPEVHGRLRCQACGSRDIAARPDWPAVSGAPKEMVYPDYNSSRGEKEADALNAASPSV